eukprot:jgi/Bigna1/80153/fgenesh1_pg.68_\
MASGRSRSRTFCIDQFLHSVLEPSGQRRGDASSERYLSDFVPSARFPCGNCLKRKHDTAALLDQDDKRRDIDNVEVGNDDGVDLGVGGDEQVLLTFKIRSSFLYRCIMTAALGSLLLGYDIGIISGAIIPIRDQLGLSHTQIEIMTSSLLFTSVIGSIIAGAVADMVGYVSLS